MGKGEVTKRGEGRKRGEWRGAEEERGGGVKGRRRRGRNEGIEGRDKEAIADDDRESEDKSSLFGLEVVVTCSAMCP